MVVPSGIHRSDRYGSIEKAGRGAYQRNGRISRRWFMGRWFMVWRRKDEYPRTLEVLPDFIVSPVLFLLAEAVLFQIFQYRAFEYI